MPTPTDAAPNSHRRWWKEAVVYQVYPRSFADSNGDGIGDLPGLISRLDHIAGLGVDVIWLSPHFDSPNADNGYDIRDYRKVMREFGTMADFDRLLAKCAARGMRLIIDLVVNHTSDEHAWFVESRASRDNPRRDFYIWREGANDPPNNWPSFFGGSAWTRDDATGDWYLHLFARKQPDLNWDNPEVRTEVYDLMRFWLDKGVAGFRMDVIPFISKDPSLPDLTPEQLKTPQYVYANGPRIHDHLQEMNREVLSRYDVMTVGEAFGVTDAQAPLFVGEERGELNMIFHFDIVRIDRDGWRKLPWTLPAFKEVYTRLDRAVGATGWNTVFLGNHDTPRAVSHFGDDSPAFRVPSAKALMTLVLTQRGTPFLYQGEELGMTNYPFRRIEEYDDVEVKGNGPDWFETGRVGEEEFLSHLRDTSRDHARTPMQWDASPYAGFTNGPKPWFVVNPNHREVNAAAALADEQSVYHHTRRLISLRRAESALVYGDYLDLDPAHERLFTYTRTLGNDRLLIAINFGGEVQRLALPDSPADWNVVLGNLSDRSGDGVRGGMELAPWEALVLKAR